MSDNNSASVLDIILTWYIFTMIFLVLFYAIPVLAIVDVFGSVVYNAIQPDSIFGAILVIFFTAILPGILIYNQFIKIVNSLTPFAFVKVVLLYSFGFILIAFISDKDIGFLSQTVIGILSNGFNLSIEETVSWTYKISSVSFILCLVYISFFQKYSIPKSTASIVKRKVYADKKSVDGFEKLIQRDKKRRY